MTGAGRQRKIRRLLIGVGRPGLSRGLIEDVRDALEASLRYMRLEGGRYRFTTEPNLNKVILERESAISDDRIESLLREAIGAVAPGSAELRVEPRVEASADLSDNQQLTLASSTSASALAPKHQRRRYTRHKKSWSAAAEAGAPTRTAPYYRR